MAMLSNQRVFYVSGSYISLLTSVWCLSRSHEPCYWHPWLATWLVKATNPENPLAYKHSCSASSRGIQMIDAPVQITPVWSSSACSLPLHQSLRFNRVYHSGTVAALWTWPRSCRTTPVVWAPQNLMTPATPKGKLCPESAATVCCAALAVSTLPWSQSQWAESDFTWIVEGQNRPAWLWTNQILWINRIFDCGEIDTILDSVFPLGKM